MSTDTQATHSLILYSNSHWTPLHRRTSAPAQNTLRVRKSIGFWIFALDFLTLSPWFLILIILAILLVWTFVQNMHLHTNLFWYTYPPSVLRQCLRSSEKTKIRMPSTHPSNNPQMQFAPAPQHSIPVLPGDGYTIIPVRYSIDVCGLGWKLLGLQRLNDPGWGFILYARIMWYDNSITITSFIIPSNTNILALVGWKPNNQMYNILEYYVHQ